MKLSNKDFEFLLKLKSLFDNNELEIELKEFPFKYFVLRGNYGYNIESKFNMSRQGIRWRFYRIFNLIYVSAYVPTQYPYKIIISNLHSYFLNNF